MRTDQALTCTELARCAVLISEMEQWRREHSRYKSVLILQGGVEISDAAGIVGDYKRLKAQHEARSNSSEACEVTDPPSRGVSWFQRNTITLLTLLLAGGLLWTLPK